MRIIGLLSWYAERPSWLAGSIASFAEAGLTHLVAVDGAYALFPDGQARSSSTEADTIVETCNALGLHLTLIRPDTVWEGNEIAKRNAMWRYADAISQDIVDWCVVLDADEFVTRALGGWEHELAKTDLDAADVMLWERDLRDTDGKAQLDRVANIDPVSRSAHRMMFRAIHGTRCVGNHYTYRAPDGRTLWGDGGTVPGVDLTDHVHVEHRTAWRSQHRKGAAHAYYARRNRAGIEHPMRAQERTCM